MHHTEDLLKQITDRTKEQFHDRQTILNFSQFLERVGKDPMRHMRNAATYIRDAFEYYGKKSLTNQDYSQIRWQLFDLGTERNTPIIGCEDVQHEIFRVLNTFVRQGYSNKLIVLHGPNGSAKTSTIECIANALRLYSETEEGAVYRFNWIFPTDKSALPQGQGEVGPIGFSKRPQNGDLNMQSYAHIDESKIASKIHSEFKENPLFLIPRALRASWLKSLIKEHQNIPEEEVTLPPHILLSGLSKRNQEIKEQLNAAYNGDFARLLRHVQVERFFFSKQYRVGISTVEPQMSIDAAEKQLTMDRNMANIPSVLQNIRFHEAVGPLVEANRGLLEFSDLLKRPIEAFKYLLSTVEKSAINLPTSTANLDIVFFATTNEKHLDAFKTLPDFASFRSRFELITAPYLLKPSEEAKIYQNDLEILANSVPIAPHTLELLSLWSVMTRYKQPDPEAYPSKHRSLIARLDPYSKSLLYEGKSLAPRFKPNEETALKELRTDLIKESHGTVVYEGRFGASPREIRSILYKAVQNPRHKTLTPMAIFEELESLVKDRSVYEFLQLEPRGKYHQPAEYIKTIKEVFAREFEREATLAMSLVEEGEYENLLMRYVNHVVAYVKKEKIYNKITGAYDSPSNELMQQVEDILKITGSVDRHREGLLAKVAAYRLENPDKAVEITEVFHSLLTSIQDYYHKERKKVVDQTFRAMLALDTDHESTFLDEDLSRARATFANLESRFRYDRHSARECLKFLLSYKDES